MFTFFNSSSRVGICAVFFILLFINSSLAAVKSESMDELYHRAQQEFNRSNFPEALNLFEQYVKNSNFEGSNRIRLIWSIDLIGRIYLRTNHDLNGALKFFSSIVTHPNLNEEEVQTIEGWLAAVIDWKKLGKLPSEVTSADMLYAFGSKYFAKGMDKLKYPLDRSGNADFHIAAGYLVPLIVHYDNYALISEALYMMGNIRRLVQTDRLYWSENFYLKEVIRRFPHSQLAEKSYDILEDGVEFAYSGSSGTHVPDVLLNMLKRYKKQAMRQK